MSDPYNILNLPLTATYEQIKQNYRHLTRNLHPDKQPIENYQIARSTFELIDKSYKSISSNLRMYIYQIFGIKGIKIFDQFPLQFAQFQPFDQNDQYQCEKLFHLIIYILNEQHAAAENDQYQISNQTVLNADTLLFNNTNHQLLIQNQSNDNKNNNYHKYQNNYNNIANLNVQYETPTINILGLSNSISIINQVKSYKNQQFENMINFALKNSKRFENGVLTSIEWTINAKQYQIEAIIEKSYSDFLLIKIIPIIIHNKDILPPKIIFNENSKLINFSCLFDYHTPNLQISESGNKNLNRSLKLILNSNNKIVLNPRIQKNINNNLRLFGQIIIQQNNLIGLSYGYKLKLTQELSLEVSSFIVHANYLQIVLQNQRTRIDIPFIFPNIGYYQVYKLLIFGAIYLSYKVYQQICYRLKDNRKRLIHENINRLNNQKLQANKYNYQNEDKAQLSRIKEMKFNGLIIIKAYIGAEWILNKIIRNIKQIINKNKNKKKEQIKLLIEQIEQKLQQNNIICGNQNCEIYQITNYIQSYVIGGQIINGLIPKCNACLIQTIRPNLIIYYWQRREIKIKQIYIQNINQNNYFHLGSIKQIKQSNKFINWIYSKLF